MLTILLAVTLPASPAHANIALDKVLIEFSPSGRPVENISVINQSDKPTKVSVAVIEVNNSGQDSEKENPSDKIIAAPKAFELGPNETRTVRLVLRNHPENLEGIYRVRFIPSEPSFHQEQEVSGKTVRVGIVMSMGALVLVPPKNPQPNLVITRDKDTIRFNNQGNITAHIQREDFCLDEKTCIPLPGKRVYPGMTWEMKVPAELSGKEFNQTVMMNGSFSKVSYPLQ